MRRGGSRLVDLVQGADISLGIWKCGERAWAVPSWLSGGRGFAVLHSGVAREWDDCGIKGVLRSPGLGFCSLRALYILYLYSVLPLSLRCRMAT